jgi:hypothetical protein
MQPCNSWTQEDFPHHHSLLRDPTPVVRGTYQDRGFVTTPVALVGHSHLSTEVGPLGECEVELE